MSRILIVGASKGLGRALVDGLGDKGDSIIGVSRKRPQPFPSRTDIDVTWVEADYSEPRTAAMRTLKALDKSQIDVVVYNLGVWETKAFEDDYDFLSDDDEEIMRMVSTNVTAAILFSKAVMPLLLKSPTPRFILTGSTSGLRQSGRPEVTFGATKSALNGIADALREGFRAQRLAVTTLQLGYLNTEDDLRVEKEAAAGRGNGSLIPVHDVVAMVRSILSLSSASFVRELVMPAILDSRF